MILFLTNADSEVLAVRTILDGLPAELGQVRCANPMRGEGVVELTGVRAVIVRLLGGRRAWEEGFDRLRASCMESKIPLLAFGGEAVPDTEMLALSTVAPGLLAEGFAYLMYGGLANIENFLLLMGDRVLGLGLGYGPAEAVPSCGLMGDPRIDSDRPTVGVLFYRALYVAGNVLTIRELCQAIEAAGANAVPVFCYSLRGDAGDVALALLESMGIDVLVTTVWAAGSAAACGDEWDVTRLASLDIPVVQGIAATCSIAQWEGSSIGLAPADVAMSVAIPEFDGRIISVPFSFKEVVDDGEGMGGPVVAYRSVPDRLERVAEVSVRLARLRHLAAVERRIAIVLSAYPTKRSRIGNAVGLDTPASVVLLAAALRNGGYSIEGVPASGDELMEELAYGLIYDTGVPVEGVLGKATGSIVGRLPAHEYTAWFSTLDKGLRDRVVEAWGEPPGNLFTDPGTGDLLFAGMDLGNVLVAIQPPRGFGENPVAVYHSPDLAPTHHYLGFYRWLESSFGAHAIIHVGKHGTLEWLPGKGVGLSAGCFPDVALGSMPLIYPFVVNDPGEGAQAKRRSHAVIVDHLVPPMTRAGSYDELANLESLLDEHAKVLSLDPAKLPRLREQIWEMVVSANIHNDLGMENLDRRDDFEEDSFDELVGELDGYLCELKDAPIRGGLHILGVPPVGEALIDMVLAITRLAQGDIPSLRETVSRSLGIEMATAARREVDVVEAECRRLVEGIASRGWKTMNDGESWSDSESEGTTQAGGTDTVLEWTCDRLIPALQLTTGEIDAVLNALDGRFVPPGPSGAPTRGMAHVLPTGRNFYTLDPRGVPSRLSWEVGRQLAERLVERYMSEEGRHPSSVALVVWGTATMRTAGDDISEALALLGVCPVWDGESNRVAGLRVIPLVELGRPRVGVTLRISGFFRDAFSHLIEMFDEAVGMVARLEESPELNPVAAEHRSGTGHPDPRVFGPKPGSYGSGILPLIESGKWSGDADIARVYLEWSGYSYGRGGQAIAAHDALSRRLGSVQVAVKNQDNREHDIFDSDDYLQDHGGMVAAIRVLSGVAPKAYFGDSAHPANPRVRDLAEEAARVVRTRVVNPKWIEAMRRHGYKGAFEMAATVDYLFGYDATAQIAEDWMYEKVTERYVADVAMREFFRRSNPHALRSIAERLLEASARGMWEASPDALGALQAAVLETEWWEEAGDRPTA